MPRKPRVEYAGAVYHVMSRGNRGEAIVRDDKDRETFVDTLDEACTRTGWLVHAFVLMVNHYHLLMETPEANLVAGMKWLQGTYTQRFNSRHKLRGHLLQGRYKALPVDSGARGGYFQTVGSYIHLNPARAGLFDLKRGSLEDFRWSSYPLYFTPSKRPEWLCVSKVLGDLGVEDDRQGRNWYREYMKKRVLEIALSDSPWEVDAQWAKIRRGWYFGSDGFCLELLARLDESLEGKRVSSFSGDAIRLHNESEAEKLLEGGLQKLGIPAEALKSMKKGAPEKMALAWLLKRKTVMTNEWISRHLFCGHPANIPGYVRKVSEATTGQLGKSARILKSED